MQSQRVNLALPVDLVIQIEKACDKRGIDRSKYIREAIFEKMNRSEDMIELRESYNALAHDMSEQKKIMGLILALLSKQ